MEQVNETPRRRDARARLEEAMQRIVEVQKICKTPSISLGVVFEGEILYRNSIGLRDVEKNKLADCDTSYHIGSCSKLFTSTAVGILADSDALSWTDTVQKHLPDFNPTEDPNIGQEATIVDVARHSTGLANPNAVIVGPGGTRIVKAEDHVKLVNALPTSNDSGQRFNNWWYYSNATFGLLANIVEATSGLGFSTFLRERICSPLGLNQTLLTEADVDSNANVAHPYVQKRDGSWSKININVTSEAHGPLLACMGVLSSVNDLLSFSVAVMSRYDTEKEKNVQNSSLLTNSSQNPLRQISSMWNWW